jgi:hypothetical protein
MPHSARAWQTGLACAAAVMLATACEPSGSTSAASSGASTTAPSASVDAPARGPATTTAASAATAAAPPSAEPGAPPAEPGRSARPSAAAPAVDGDFPAVPATGILAAGVADKVLAAGRAPTVRLVTAGAEPRAPIAYALTKGATVPFGMALDMTMGVKTSSRAVQPTAIPRLALGLDLTTTDVDASGDAHVDAKLTRAAAEPKGAEQEAMAKALDPALAALRGFSMSYRVGPTGRIHDLVAKAPPDAPQGAQQVLGGVSQSFESMVAPLPSEPVGVGARWRVVTRVTAAGPDLLQLATYTLASRDGQSLGLDVTLTQVAASDVVKTPGMPDTVTARLKSFRSSGKGSTTVDLASVAPIKGSMSVESSMDVEIATGPGPGQRTSADSTMRVEYSRPAKAAAP